MLKYLFSGVLNYLLHERRPSYGCCRHSSVIVQAIVFSFPSACSTLTFARLSYEEPTHFLILLFFSAVGFFTARSHLNFGFQGPNFPSTFRYRIIPPLNVSSSQRQWGSHFLWKAFFARAILLLMSATFLPSPWDLTFWNYFTISSLKLSTSNTIWLHL